MKEDTGFLRENDVTQTWRNTSLNKNFQLLLFGTLFLHALLLIFVPIFTFP